MHHLIFSLLISVFALRATNALAQTAAPADKAFLQSAATERLYLVTIVTAKSEFAREANAFIKDEMIPAYVKGGQKHLECWRPMFGEANEYWFIAPLANFAEFDKPDSGFLLKGLGSPEAAVAYRDKVNRLSASSRRFVIRVQPELSYLKPDAPLAKIAVVQNPELTRTREAEFANYLKNDALPLVKKSGRIGRVTAYSIYGETGWFIFEPQESFADLDKGSSLRQVLDVEAVRKMQAKLLGVVARTKPMTVITLRPELSILPK